MTSLTSKLAIGLGIGGTAPPPICRSTNSGVPSRQEAFTRTRARMEKGGPLAARPLDRDALHER